VRSSLRVCGSSHACLRTETTHENTAVTTASTASLRADVKVIGVIGIAHCLSHFFQLVLPPLFPLLKSEFGVSYATLGAVMGMFYVASGFSQFTAGFAVDRFGARPVLLGGFGLFVGGVLLASTVGGVGWLFPIAAVMGIGNGVFHPVDFAVLNANVAPKRLGHAYSVHGIGGSLGYAVAPLVSFGLASALGWRSALLVMGGAGVVVLIVLASLRETLKSRQAGADARPSLQDSFKLFREKTILLCFAYFCLVTVATMGIQTFAATALNAAYAIPLALATSAVTAYLLGNTSGIVAGGFLASRVARHDRVAATGLAIASVLVLALASFPALAAWAIALFALAGFAIGATSPSRDMIVRAATPPGASGRVYGFVYSGLDLGSTIGPILLGLLLDHSSPRMAFFAVAAFLAAGIATVVQVRRSAFLPAHAQAAD